MHGKADSLVFAQKRALKEVGFVLRPSSDSRLTSTIDSVSEVERGDFPCQMSSKKDASKKLHVTNDGRTSFGMIEWAAGVFPAAFAADFPAALAADFPAVFPAE